MIVIASDTALAVGEHRIGRVSDANSEWQDAAFVVIREATESEYIQSALDHGASIYAATNQFPYQVRFYEVATD